MERKLKSGVTFVLMKPNMEILMQLRDDGNGKKIKYPNRWCIPGGGMEENESPVETVIRELEEEYELKVNENKIHFVCSYEHEEEVDYVYLCELEENASPVLNEGKDMKWLALDEIRKMELAWEQDKILPIIEKYIKESY